MPQTRKYVYDSNDTNSAPPSGSYAGLEENGYAQQQILPSDVHNFYMQQSNNWCGNFKSLATVNDDTLDLPASTAAEPFDFIILTSTNGCEVNIDLSQVGITKLAPGQVIELFNNTNVFASYQINSDPSTKELISPMEKVSIMIISSTEIINLTDLQDTHPTGTVIFSVTGGNTGQFGRLWAKIDSFNSLYTIGNAASGAAYAGDKYKNLYIQLWEAISNLAVVQGGRGTTALADYTANKAITLQPMLGRTLTVPDDAAGFPSGVTGGNPTMSLTEANNGPHAHSYEKVSSIATKPLDTGSESYIVPTVTDNTSVSGSGTPFSLWQPYAVPFFYIRI